MLNLKSLTAFFWIFFLTLFGVGLNKATGQGFACLIVAAVTLYALHRGSRDGILFGGFAGLLVSIFSSQHPAFWIFMFALTGWIAGIASSKIFPDSLFAQTLLPALLSGFLVLAGILHSTEESFFAALLPALREFLTALVVSPGVFYFLNRVGFTRVTRKRLLTIH